MASLDSRETSLAGVLAEDYAERPYWWDVANPLEGRSHREERLDANADVVIVGGGITGTVAALKLARAGAQVIVVDAQAIGEGAARRNAGFIGRTLKRSVAWLEARRGAGHGVRVYRELDDALDSVRALVEEEGIACHHRICGRFIAANSPAHMQLLIDDLEVMRRLLGFPYERVDVPELATEIASDRFVGGAVIPDLGSIHSGLYHRELVALATQAGARFEPHTEVGSISSGDGDKTVTTNRGTLRAKHVVVTTNGYTKRLSWFARRVIPFRGYVLATELLAPGLIDKVLPKRRTYLDTKLNIDFIRPAPDSERILFGGMTGTPAPSATAMVPILLRRLTTILPDLEGTRVSRAWSGHCAGTFDFMPHIGCHDGIHFALGYNFAGIPIGTSFAMKIAARILGRGDAASAFEARRFPTVPFYSGSPWFVPLAMRYFDRHDRRIAGSHAKSIVS